MAFLLCSSLSIYFCVHLACVLLLPLEHLKCQLWLLKSPHLDSLTLLNRKDGLVC